MSLSLYDISVPVFIRSLKNLSGVLKKAEAYADEKGIPHEEFMQARLFEDMKPLTFQIQTASDTARGPAVRISGVEKVSMADTEKTFEELQQRIQKTIDFLEKVDERSMDGKEDLEVALGERFKFSAKTYMQNFALPNFFFHVTTAYGIVRSKGVPVGKGDFLGSGR